MKKMLLFIIVIVFMFTSCEVQPNFNPKNIVFTPISGRVGDIITVTGDDFLKTEEYERLYDIFQDCTNDEDRENNFVVLFDVKVTKYEKGGALFENVSGTPALDIVSIKRNSIQCRVPEGAKSGKLLVHGVFVNYQNNPSERNFIVLDASGDEVW